MYAIIQDRGRQYRVEEGSVVNIDLLSTDNDSIEFENVLLVGSDDGVKVGQPTVASAKVSAKVLEAVVKGPKIEVMKFRRRKDSQTKRGHRQKYTRVQIEKIHAG